MVSGIAIGVPEMGVDDWEFWAPNGVRAPLRHPAVFSSAESRHSTRVERQMVSLHLGQRHRRPLESGIAP